MSVRQIKCPECKNTSIEMQRDLTPETTSMNTKAVLVCLKCRYEWEGKITSKHTNKKR